MIISYIPNRISLTERAVLTVASVLLFSYGSYGIWVDDLYVPARYGPGVHFQDFPALMMYGAMVCASLVMLSIVVDHYDRRPNERHYKSFARIVSAIGWGLFGISLLAHLFGRA